MLQCFKEVGWGGGGDMDEVVKGGKSLCGRGN